MLRPPIPGTAAGPAGWSAGTPSSAWPWSSPARRCPRPAAGRRWTRGRSSGPGERTRAFGECRRSLKTREAGPGRLLAWNLNY